jgi:hypothetical protein
MVLVLGMEALILGCGSDGSEFVTDDIKFVPYTNGLWKFENGQRFYLKKVNNTEGLIWEIG